MYCILLESANCLNDLGNVGDFLSGLVLFTSSVAICFSIRAFKNTKYGNFLKMLRTYQDKKMSKSLVILHKLYRECEKEYEEYEKKHENIPSSPAEKRRGIEKLLVNKYVKDLKDNDKSAKYKFHYHRRRVSHFYQQLALMSKNFLSISFISRFFGQEKIIPDILLPIELNAISYYLSSKKRKSLVPSMEALKELYNELGKRKYAKFKDERYKIIICFEENQSPYLISYNGENEEKAYYNIILSREY